MITRAIDTQNDWTYGKGLEDYKSGLDAVAQNIKTRLQSFLGDCFFAKSDGLDWFNLIGGKNQITLNLAVSAIISNTSGVVSLTQLAISLSAEREFSVQYKVTTSFGTVVSSVEFVPVNFLLTQDGDRLVTEDGSGIIV